jgi:hypothetical protein
MLELAVQGHGIGRTRAHCRHGVEAGHGMFGGLSPRSPVVACDPEKAPQWRIRLMILWAIAECCSFKSEALRATP